MAQLLVGDPTLNNDPLAQYAGMEDVSLPTVEQLQIIYGRIGELKTWRAGSKWNFECVIAGEVIRLRGRTEAWDWYLKRRDYLEGVAAARSVLVF